MLVAEWFKLLWCRMGFTKEGVISNEISNFGWLYQFVAAANEILKTTEKDNQQNMILLKYGSRRAREFLSDRNCNPSPFFGLHSGLSMHGLKEKLDGECGISYLRKVAEVIGLKRGDGMISYTHNTPYRNRSGSAIYFELATIDSSVPEKHARWICPYAKLNSTYDRPPDRRKEYIVNKGEQCYIASQGESEIQLQNIEHAYLTWVNPPSIYLQGDVSDTEDAMPRLKKAKVAMKFVAIIGDWKLGLFLRDEARRIHDPLQSHQERAKLAMAKTEKVSTSVQMLRSMQMAPERLRDYMCSLTYVSEKQLNEDSPTTDGRWVGMQSISSAPGISLVSSAHRFHPDFSKSLYALNSASLIYKTLERASISLKLIGRPLCKSSWCKSLFRRWEPLNHGISVVTIWSSQATLLTPQQPPPPNRHESFSCIALFDSGSVDLNPDDFEHSFAVCSEDTIYVPEILLTDPFTKAAEHKIRSITGNISHPGISILVSPFEPRIRELGESYNLVAHETYNFKREDNFKETSLHLSFTDWTFPLATGDSRTIDHDAQVVEAVISVRDRGKWVADIDILGVNFDEMTRFTTTACCKQNHEKTYEYDYTSIDSWEELLDQPNTVGIVRAHGNWAARLAAVSILSRNGFGGNNFGVLGPETFCLKCLEELFEKPGWNMLDYESTLPSFCID